MSVEAWNRVLNGKCGGGNKKVVLLGYANHTDREGRNAFPSYPTIAEYAECDPKTVARAVRSLERDGWMRRGDQELVSHIRADRRPIVFDVAMSDEIRAQWAAEAAGEVLDQVDVDEHESAGEDGSERGDNLSGRSGSADDDGSGARPDTLTGRGDEEVPGHGGTSETSRPDKAVSPEPSVTIQDPPTPIAVGCPAHPTGQLNCRGCGTTPRQLAAAAKQHEADRIRLETEAAHRRERIERAERRIRDQAKAEQNAALARAAIARSRAESAAAREPAAHR